MTHYHRMSIDMDLNRDWQKLLSARLHGYYDSINNRRLEDMLSAAEAQSDKLAAMLKDIAQAALHRHIEDRAQEAEVLAQLTRSIEFVNDRKVVPISERIGYLGIDDGGQPA